MSDQLLAHPRWTWAEIRDMEIAYHVWGPVGYATAWGYMGA